MAYQKLGSFDDAYIKQSSPSSYQQIQAAKSAWEAANAAGDRAGMDAAHQAAESIRAAYGYSGGVDGSQYLPNAYAPIRNQYMDAANAAAQAYRLAAQQGASQLEAQRPQIQADYDALAKQTYINYMKEKQSLPETMAKLGITGQGAAESTAASQSNQYQQNVLEGELARQEALQGLNNRINELYQQGELQAAQAQADILMSLAQGYPDFLESQQEWEYKLAQQQAEKNQQAWENSQQEWKNQQQIREQQLAAQKEAADQQQDAFNRQLAVAKILAQYGDFSGYISLGFNEDQIAQMRRAWQLQQLQK